jgi:UDP:flavonoid glycosyltransferase YjiC (YdhE family)
MEPFTRFRSGLGLPPLQENPLMLGQHAPGLSVALFSPLLASRQPDWPSQVVECGFPFDPRIDGGEVPEEIERFLDRGPAPVVFTLGSAASLEPGDFIEQSTCAAQLIGARAIILSGRDGPRGFLAGDGSIIAEPWLPHAAIFPRARVVVHQGGIGTLSHALAAGVPMLVVPHAHDQPDNARRAAALGVARVLPRSRYTPDGAASALRSLVGDAEFTVRARELAPAIAEERGGEVAAAAIERMHDAC